MFNTIPSQRASTHNQNLAAATGQTVGIQAPTPAEGVLVAVPSARVSVVNNPPDEALRFKQELQQWVEQASQGGGGGELHVHGEIHGGSADVRRLERRQQAAERIFEVYENSGTELDLKHFYLTSLPNLARLGQLQSLALGGNNFGKVAETHDANEAFFNVLSQLSKLQVLDLSQNCLGALSRNTEAAKRFFDGLGRLNQLQNLQLGFNDLGALADNTEAAKAFGACLGQLKELHTLGMESRRIQFHEYKNLGDLAKNPEAAKAFGDAFGQLIKLQHLDLRDNNLGALYRNTEAAKAFGGAFGQLIELRTLDLSGNYIGDLAENPEAAKAFADRMGRLTKLQALHLRSNRLCALAGDIEAAKAFGGAFGQLIELRTLDLSDNFIGKLANNTEAAKVFFDGLGQPIELRHLDLRNNDLGDLYLNTKAAKAFGGALGQLIELRHLNLRHNNLGALYRNTEAAKALGGAFGQLIELLTLGLSCNLIGDLAKNPEAAKVFADGMGRQRKLQDLGLRDNHLGDLANNTEAAKAFSGALGQLEQLQDLDLSSNDLGHFARNAAAYTVFFERLGQLGQLIRLQLDLNKLCVMGNKPLMHYFRCLGQLHNLQNLTEGDLCAWPGNPQESFRFRAMLRKHNIGTQHKEIVELGAPWSNNVAQQLIDQCATVTDAISAYGILGHAYDKGKITWPEVQGNLEAVCLAVAVKLSNADISNGAKFAKVRNQELAYLLGVVQHGADIGALTNIAVLNIKRHIQTSAQINQAFSAIEAWQQNQQAFLSGLQSACSVLGWHMVHTAQIQAQFGQCFQKLAENQQQLLEGQNQLANADKQRYQELEGEIEILKGKQKEIADNLHQLGLKMLYAKRIRAVGGTLGTGAVFLPWMGPSILEGTKAIANALGVANTRGFDAGLGNLKESLSRISGESVFQNTPEELKEITLGATLHGHGIELPDDELTTQFAAITLGELSEGIRSASN